MNPTRLNPIFLSKNKTTQYTNTNNIVTPINVPNFPIDDSKVSSYIVPNVSNYVVPNVMNYILIILNYVPSVPNYIPRSVPKVLDPPINFSNIPINDPNISS